MIWCLEEDSSIRDIEVYALQSTGFEAKGFEYGTSFCEALRTIHDTFDEQRKRMIAQGKMPECPPPRKRGGKCQ